MDMVVGAARKHLRGHLLAIERIRDGVEVWASVRRRRVLDGRAWMLASTLLEPVLELLAGIPPSCRHRRSVLPQEFVHGLWLRGSKEMGMFCHRFLRVRWISFLQHYMVVLPTDHHSLHALSIRATGHFKILVDMVLCPLALD